MPNRGLLFIPDISGFTRFVNETEIDHSRLIIQELLEILINSNEIGLEVSEIEGDAILFYKFGDMPPLEDLYTQVAKMFIAFHQNLNSYEYRRFCQCKACTSAINLTLKVITHYGEFAGYNVKNFSKLIGKDVIVAHQLLKNDIEHHEYWLVTTNLSMDNPPAVTQWMKWDARVKQTESGDINFHYTALSPLRKDLPPDPFQQPDLSKKKKVFSVSREYDTDIITLFHATGDFNYRSRWKNDVKMVEEVTHILPRIGMRCRCVLENGESVIYSSSFSFSPERIGFSETTEEKNISTCYTLEKIEDRRTKLTIDIYYPKSLTGLLSYRLWHKKKTDEGYRQSLQNLEGLVKEIKLPGQPSI
jgi:hypothetical protein